MSFSKQVKGELLEKKIEDDGDSLSFLCGIIRAAGNIRLQENEVEINVISDVIGLYDYCNLILKRLYGDYAELEITDKAIINKTTYFDIKFPPLHSKQILLDLGMLTETLNGLKLQKKTDTHLLGEQSNIIAFLKGVFLACATNSIKLSQKTAQKSSSGYHLEFISKDKDFLSEVASLLAGFEIFAKLIERKNTYVLYLKDANSISDLLTLIGANEAMLTLQNEMATREIRNTVNRQINCISANISKTVGANLKQLEAINIINSTIGIDNLPPELEEVALLRLANTEESLQELSGLSALKLSKSGINHRMTKILKIAKELKD